MSITPVELANPNVGMDNFISGLKDAGMEQAVTESKNESEKPLEKAPKPEAAEKPKATNDGISKSAEEAARNSGDSSPRGETKPAPEEDEEGDDKWPRTAKDWKTYKQQSREKIQSERKEKEQLKTERDQIKAEIEQLKKSGPSPELEQLKKEKAELDERLRLVAVERHPKFEAYFNNKTTAQLELAKKIVGSDKGEQIASLLKAPDGPIKEKELNDLIDTLSPLQQSRLGSVMNALTEIQSEKESEIAKSRENYDTIQKKEKEQAESNQKQFLSTFDTIIKQATDPKDGNPVFQKREGDEAWNSEVDKRIDMARNFIANNHPPDTIAKAALAAVAYPAILKTCQSQAEEIASLKTQIKGLQSATPKVESTKATETGPVVEKLKPGHTDPHSAIDTWMKGMAQE